MGRSSGWLGFLLVYATVFGAGELEVLARGGNMDELARRYVILVLAMGKHDDSFVDAYYGPESLRQEAERQKLGLAELESACAALARELEQFPLPELAIEAGRLHYLRGQMRAFLGRIALLRGERLSFSQEAERLYDVIPPHFEQAHFREILAKLDRELPGEGTVSDRLERYRQRFAIPPEKVDAVFQAAIQEARKRTQAWVKLPEGENFRLEYVKGKPWSGYNWYQGGYQSLIQVNTELLITIDRAVDLACHEGYPGHHLYNVLLEKELTRGRGWVEFSVYPLFSPQSLIAEGTANFGIEVCFPGAARLEFEKQVLFPLAGLDPTEAERYYRIQALQHDLNYVHNEAARDYLEGRADAAATQRLLVEVGLMSEGKARQRLGFIEKYRSYVLNYNLGMDLVAQFINKEGGTADKPEIRWKSFVELLTRPVLPSELKP